MAPNRTVFLMLCLLVGGVKLELSRTEGDKCLRECRTPMQTTSLSAHERNDQLPESRFVPRDMTQCHQLHSIQ